MLDIIIAPGEQSGEHIRLFQLQRIGKLHVVFSHICIQHFYRLICGSNKKTIHYEITEKNTECFMQRRKRLKLK